MAQLIDFTGMELRFVHGSASGKQYPVTEFRHPSATGQLCWDSVKLRLCPPMGTRIDCAEFRRLFTWASLSGPESFQTGKLVKSC